MYSDLATECVASQGDASAGFAEQTERYGGILVRTVQITDEVVGKSIGKAPGTYTTVEAPLSGASAKISYILAEKLRGAVLKKLRLSLSVKRNEKLPLVLAVGLGNEHLSCDALGAMTVAKCSVGRGARARVVTLKPGVEGVTGLPAAEVIFSLIARIRPDAVVLIDALVASRFFHIGRTFQLSDAGIIPGSGTGNRVYEISEKTTGVPCFALGVPLAVSCETVATEFDQRRKNAVSFGKSEKRDVSDKQNRSGLRGADEKNSNCYEAERRAKTGAADGLKESGAAAGNVGENGAYDKENVGEEGGPQNRESNKARAGKVGKDECAGDAGEKRKSENGDFTAGVSGYNKDAFADFSRYIVCPREVDLIALRAANILAQAIDRAFL